MSKETDGLPMSMRVSSKSDRYPKITDEDRYPDNDRYIDGLVGYKTTLSESLGDTDPVADHIATLTAQRDEYRQHMERYQDEVKELKERIEQFDQGIMVPMESVKLSWNP